MFYSIKIRLPKNKAEEYAGSNYKERNFSTLSDSEILDLLNNYANHIALAKNFAKNFIKHNQENLFWDPTPNQIQFIQNFYSNPNIQFADNNTTPGQNNTLDENSGKQIYTVLLKSQLTIDEINRNYTNLGLKPQNCIRYIGKNYFIPNDINPSYANKTKLLWPTKEIFEQMLRDFVKNKWVKLPLSTNTWDKAKYFRAYYFDGQYYEIPRTDSDKFLPEFLDTFNKVRYEIMPLLELQFFTIDSISALRENLPNPTSTEYEKYRLTLPDCWDARTNQPAKYFPEEDSGINYYASNYDKLSQEVREELQKDVITSNSIANEVFRDIRDNQKDLLNIEKDFETEFKCFRDPRFSEFLQTLDKIDNKPEDRNIFRYLFNALKYREIKEISGVRSFNISTDHFKTEKTNLPEFQLFWNRGWYCKTNVLQENELNLNGFKLTRANFSPENYKFDAVLQKNNKIYCILEYDGLDHFRPRNESSNFLLKLTSDQIKCAFVEYLKKNGESIKIIRIPDYKKLQKNDVWKNQFKQFILNILNEYLGNQQTPETVNPAVREIPAYKIRKMIK